MPAFAQETAREAAASAADAGGEIIVTARKRNETAIDVPVALVALGKADLERYGTRDLTQVASQVPGLIIATTASGSGGSVSLRGVTSPPQNPSADQGVSFNVDGVQVGSVNIARLGMIDLQQVEVLKGPQALFFGKNSPGGIISLRSADPGPDFEATAIGSYEFHAREKTGQLAAGGPLTPTLGVRGVVYWRHSEGDRRNLAPILTDPATPGGTYAFGPAFKREPRKREVFFRGTMVFDPSDAFTLRAKYNYNRLNGSSPFDNGERWYCPRGAPQVTPVAAAVDDCRMDGTNYHGQIDPRVIQKYGQFIFAPNRLKSWQHLASLEANFTLAPDITLTSVSGLYKLKERYFDTVTYSPVSNLIAGTRTNRREISQEVRFTTAREDWPVNIMVGGYYQDSKFFTNTPIFSNNALAGTSSMVNSNEFFINSEAYSFFGQAIWKIVPTLELAAGMRYSSEKKSLVFFQTVEGPVGVFPRSLIPTAKPSQKFTDKSPEVTLTWKPTPTLSVFGAFRNGFKSGGYGTGSGAVRGADLTYRPEDVRGFEIGTKALLGDLRVNATAYRYNYKDLQVVTFDPIAIAQKVINAAAARIQGLELDATYSPRGVPGLTLRGAVNYNHARYREFLAGCWVGQTVAEGCSLSPNPALVAALAAGFNPAAGGAFPAGAAYRQQDLSGAQLNLAPDWTGNIGVTYTTPITDGMKISFSGDLNYQSKFWAQLEEAPFGRQKSFTKINARISLGAENDRWEVAAIGRNLTNIYRSGFVSQVSGTGISGQTGTNALGGRSDYSSATSRGREVSLQLTVKIN